MCCLICVEWQSGKLTSKEAFRNLGESLQAANENDEYEKVEHLLELSNKILDMEVPLEDPDPEVEGIWDGWNRDPDQQ